MKQLAEPVNYSEKKVQLLTNKYKVNGLTAEFAELVLPFKAFASE